ncbi:MAG: hypothetical protein DRN92_03375 [Thermoproteota archaeon]|nr:MAG: hypothetical protein DRN92_03375 [Candidatus Korarchaeota archaeon]
MAYCYEGGALKKFFLTLIMLLLIFIEILNHYKIEVQGGPDTEILRPNGAGSWTILNPYPSSNENWECVDEVVSDEDSTYVYYTDSPYPYGRDTYSLQDHSQGSGIINSVTVYVRCKKIGTSLLVACRPAIRTHSANYPPITSTEDARLLTTSWTNYYRTWTTNPYTGQAWTWSEIDSLEAGVDLHGTSTTQALCTQVWVVVDYTPDFFKPNQAFSSSANSNVSYNVYIVNTGPSNDIFDLNVSSTQTVGVDVWLDTDWSDGGDVHIAYSSDGTGWDNVYNDNNTNGKPDVNVTASSSVTLIVTLDIPSSASGTVQVTLTANASTSGAQDSVTLTTTISNSLPWPSNWYQFGSDPIDDVSPAAVDDKAFYTVNNGTHVFFRLAEAGPPNTVSYLYEVYLDTRAGGQAIGSYYYDYKLSSDGNLYNWTGTAWQAISTTIVQVSGTSIVIGADLSDIEFEDQDVHIYVRTYEGTTPKDTKGPYTTSRTFISEMSLFLVPIVATLLVLYVTRKRRR